MNHKQSVINLEKYQNKTLRIKFQGGREVVGILKGFDALTNIVLDQAVEYLRDPNDIYSITDKTRDLGTVVCRGIAIMTINPVEDMIEIQNPYEQEYSCLLQTYDVVI